ncbi:hypothetical protein MOUN0_H07756 [Monosporozyma unispora]
MTSQILKMTTLLLGLKFTKGQNRLSEYCDTACPDSLVAVVCSHAYELDLDSTIIHDSNFALTYQDTQ